MALDSYTLPYLAQQISSIKLISFWNHWFLKVPFSGLNFFERYLFIYVLRGAAYLVHEEDL